MVRLDLISPTCWLPATGAGSPCRPQYCDAGGQRNVSTTWKTSRVTGQKWELVFLPLHFLTDELYFSIVPFFVPDHKMDIVTSMKALNKLVETPQLTSDFGGTFMYRHSDWLQFYQVLITHCFFLQLHFSAEKWLLTLLFLYRSVKREDLHWEEESLTKRHIPPPLYFLYCCVTLSLAWISSHCKSIHNTLKLFWPQNVRYNWFM